MIKTPLLKDSIRIKINLLQEKFFEFNKNFVEIKQYNTRLNSMTIKEYLKIHSDMYLKLK